MNQVAAKIFHRTQSILGERYLKKNRLNLRVDDFTVISSNCWGGILYKDLGLRYQSPFVNMYMFCECFLKVTSDLPKYLSQPLIFIESSKYLPGKKITYPLGLLGDAEIHFIHSDSKDEMKERWNERVKRVNYDKMIVAMTERDGCSPELIQRFDNLPFEHKFCFTVGSYPTVKSSINLPGGWLMSEAPPADQIAGITYVRTDIVNYINNAFG